MAVGFIIAIDGPMASGKGTVAPAIAVQLDGFYLYTGATYRAVALYCIQHKVAVTDMPAVLGVLNEINIDLFDHTVLLNGEDVTEAIRRADVARATPTIAAYPEVRRRMVARQREIAQRYIERGMVVVTEGRDTATAVFPDASIKIYLTASPEVRAQRRLAQYQAQGDMEATYTSVLSDLHNRDKTDTERADDPLVLHPEEHDYINIDNSEKTEEETIVEIIAYIEKKKENYD